MEDNKEFKEEEIKGETANVEVEEDMDTCDEEVSQEAEEVKEESKDGWNPLKTTKKLKEENKKLSNEVEALKDRLLRMSAEYENFRKRTAKEKEGIYTDACTDVLKEMLPVLDNLERALLAEGSIDDVKKGIEMTIKGVSGSFEKLGVEEIDATGEFDPNLHQAVMHVQDENFNANSIAEVFQKGYKRGDKVIRYTMVKVAN
ncbi:nucleotide exchange factor GrpE [Clostridium chauvoei]|uniref:Protein GrpE n=2 Tax=Clostridium chauvoei TaxID=46867 RepID=S6FL05_9CLOT|nr:nucleotide exchange factor GrpE [Clostridium chauvoei]ATD54691.1 nucleotide exchange factor GrpE [Clostridium chauvoei]ATD57626.1 nucleotide exchange factor GrpE [Clostridium chauvoei]MBX7279989.1 nucleotide exchange factor GrpE [Clostridium chauvoei]MBX7282352.1 nucleotide exchange factor GrpE [Clostridium chauvoei]MBX7284880.1 nucleotide exchange factor GrpE [Clostridium chauvoei]